MRRLITLSSGAVDLAQKSKSKCKSRPLRHGQPSYITVRVLQ
eukprot:SAG11_NODE_15192_length_586_cov_0.733060_1_plen_41_part_10